MKAIYKIENLPNNKVVKTYNNNLIISEITEEKTNLDTSFSNSHNIEILLEGIILNIRYDSLSEPIKLNILHNTPCIRVDFEIEGHSSYKPENSYSLPVVIKNNSYNFFYFPKVKGTVTYRTKMRKSLSIMVTKDYLNKVFNNNIKDVSLDFDNAIENNTPFKMFATNNIIPSTLLFILNDIISCSYQKEIKQVYLESKIKEIFCFLFSEMKPKKADKQVNNLNKTEYLLITKAEKALQQNLNKSFTIENLASLVGMNQYKLKQNFKLVYKEPIFTYLTNIRMVKAKNMLLKDDFSVTEVAYAVGYKNPQHFTAAFKRKFNYLPSDLRKRIT